MAFRYMITAALPYANGPLHFGHLAGAYLPADVYTRHLRLQGQKAMFICGSDEHGVAIMLNARQQGVPFEEYVHQWHQKHNDLFKKYGVDFDFFGETSAPYHHTETQHWFKVLYDIGYIAPKSTPQLYCEDCHNPLPDRYVEGTCYNCGYPNARGDECPECGTWIEPEKLINPVCKICGSRNIVVKAVEQYYLMMSKFHKEYRAWLEGRKNIWRKTVYPFADSLSKEGLKDRAISRDLDWGIDVPLPEAKGKKLYVWFDAPIGYVSNTKEYLRQIGSSEDYLKDWWHNDQTRIVHFIGKDNIIFHTIIFHMMGMASGIINPPYDVPANQYLNLNGKQFSKSTGNYVDADEAITEFGQDALRYYLLSILPETADASFAWEGLAAKNNNELANNIGNLVARCLKFMAKNWPSLPGSAFANFTPEAERVKLKSIILEHQAALDGVQIRKGLETVMHLGQEANLYFTEQAPWGQFKTDPDLAAKTVANTISYIIVIADLLTPYLPQLSSKILRSLGVDQKQDSLRALYQGDLAALNDLVKDGITLTTPPEILVPKIEDKVIAAKVAALNGGGK